jgi:hypothetical protein
MSICVKFSRTHRLREIWVLIELTLFSLSLFLFLLFRYSSSSSKREKLFDNFVDAANAGLFEPKKYRTKAKTGSKNGQNYRTKAKTGAKSGLIIEQGF